MEKYRGKKVLIVGLGRTGFSLIHLFNNYECQVKVTDIKPIFDLNRQIKKLKKINPTPETVFGEHRIEDFLESDLVIYTSNVNPNLPQIQAAKEKGVEVYSEFAFAYANCHKPVIAVGGSLGRTTIAHMIGFALKKDNKKVFVGGTSEEPFSNFLGLSDKDFIDYVIVEVSPEQLQSLKDFHPILVVMPNLEENYNMKRFASTGDYIETALSITKHLDSTDHLVVNFEKLSSNYILRNSQAQTFWYSKRSFVNMGIIGEVEGTHFHLRRIHCNINCHSEFKVNKMRIIGSHNRENLLAAITACKILKVSDSSIQYTIEKFPGIPHRMEFVIEKSGVKFYNDSKSETFQNFLQTLYSLKSPVILISGGKDTEQIFEGHENIIKEKVRLMVLVGESKEAMNRFLGDHTPTYLVGSFDESVLIAYQKSRTGDTILLCPANSSTDIFRDYREKGNYYKKLIYQL